MARGYMPGGGGGNATSDDCTATKAQVLEGYTAVTSDSDDEAEEGMMPNRGNQQKATSVTTGNNNMYFRTPAGYYSATGSEEADKPEVYAPYSDVASKGGVTAAKILAGQSALGISGTATSDANAAASDMASGKSGYVKGRKVNGNLTVFGAGPTKAASHWSGGGNVYFGIQRGIYNTLAPGDDNYAQVYRTASELGITAEKIAQGQSICGVNGNYTNDATAVAADIRKNKIAYVDGKKITGSMAEQGAKTITAGTENVSAGVNGKFMTGEITVAPTPTQSKTVTPNKSSQTVRPDGGKHLSSVTVNAIPSSYKSVSTGTFSDLTPSNASATYTVGTLPSFAYAIFEATGYVGGIEVPFKLAYVPGEIRADTLYGKTVGSYDIGFRIAIDTNRQITFKCWNGLPSGTNGLRNVKYTIFN